MILAISIRIGRGGDVIGSDLVRRRLRSKIVKDLLRKAGREVPWHIVGIVRVGAGFVTRHSDAGFGNRAETCCRAIKV